jgi:ABC-type multidrug transport system fused ATPase/permease subunit
MSLDRDDDPDARTYEYADFTLLKRMTLYLLRFRKMFLGVSIMTAINIAVTIYAPFVLQHAIDVDFVSGNLSALLTTSLIYVVLMSATWITAYGQEYLMAIMGQGAVYNIRQDTYKQLQKMGEDFYDQSSSGRIISRLTNDVDRMSELLEGGLVSTFAQIFIVFGIGIVIFTVDVTMALASLSIVPILLLSTIFFRKRLRTAYRSTRKTISSVTANYAESISGAKVTKSFARERISAENFAELNQADYNANVQAGGAQATFFPVIRFISGMGISVILFVGGYLYLGGIVTLGTIVLFVQFNDRFFRPILTIANFYTSVQSAFAGAERVFSIIDSEPVVVDAPDAKPIGDIEGRIRFRDVTFGYREGPIVLQDFDLEIPPGQSVALVGDTGAGKTTVVSLLNRFYDVKVGMGAVEIDGVDIRDVTQESLHSNIGLVLQDPFLFQGTVKENIRYGRPEATDEEILRATEIIGARRIFENLDEGFETQVGERGNRLSEGERQLVSFARALLANPTILILDEATSSIDIYTEHAIQKGMKALLKGRTSIVVAHRLSTIVNADRIVVLEHGRIVETGRHADLMANEGKYYSLYELQIRPRAMRSSS